MAASSSFEGSENITSIDPEFYEAAADGDIDFFEVHGMTNLNVLLTPNKNTVLHIYITALDAEAESPTNFVDEVLKIHPSLLWQSNANDEIPLHIAARYGHTAVIKFLLERAAQDPESGFGSAREMLEMANKEKDTALHEAVRYKHVEAAKLLIKKDPEFSYIANAAGETPLYMAAERNFRKMVSEIIDTCKSPAYGGPLGRTALHAAVYWNSKGMLENITRKIEGICKEADQKGWTPLHLAAHYNKTESTMMLLEYDRDAAYMKDTKGRTALHIAAHRGFLKVIKSIISICPDCCELIDNRGRNALHFAVDGCQIPGNDIRRYDERIEVIRAILDNRPLGNLLNQKDANGDTPLHHLFRSSWFDEHLMIFMPKMSRNKGNLLVDHRVDKMAFNKKNANAYETTLSSRYTSRQKKQFLFSEGLGGFHTGGQRVPDAYDRILKRLEEEKEKLNAEAEEELKKGSGSHLVVATLITGVTCAAGITMPGGFISGDDKSHPPGSAVLRKHPAFKAFIITDALSMLLSSTVVLIHLAVAIMRHESFRNARKFLITLSFKMLMLAMLLVVLAFITATYSVLAQSLDLAVPTLIFCLLFFVTYHVALSGLGFVVEKVNFVMSGTFLRIYETKKP